MEVVHIVVEAIAGGRIRVAAAAATQGDRDQKIALAEGRGHQVPVARGAVPPVHEENDRTPPTSPFDAVQPQAMNVDKSLPGSPGPRHRARGRWKIPHGSKSSSSTS